MTRIRSTGKDIIHKDLSYRILSCAFEVHRLLGPGFSEKVYEEALARELKDNRIPCERQKRFAVFYKRDQVGEYVADIVVDGKVILELKAVSEILPLHCAQALAYLKASSLTLAIVLNFGGLKLTQERVVL